ncbi:MAG: hypothetical protein J5I98_18590 [Phaeodactylibacter sp.]|nr:hypothetical protein [Phaeodactylibacter sp.]
MNPTYIDLAWQDHAAKIEELNALIAARETIEAQIARASQELESLAEQAADALPWGLEIGKVTALQSEVMERIRAGNWDRARECIDALSSLEGTAPRQ